MVKSMLSDCYLRLIVLIPDMLDQNLRDPKKKSREPTTINNQKIIIMHLLHCCWKYLKQPCWVEVVSANMRVEGRNSSP